VEKRFAKMVPGLAVLLLAILLLAWPARSSTTTLAGNITDAQGNPVNGTLTMQLPVPAMATGSNVLIVPNITTYSLVNGFIQAGPPLYDVATLQPSNLYYTAKVYDMSGTLLMVGNYVVTGGVYNIGAAVPTNITTSNISFVSPVTTGVPNNFTATQTFSVVSSASTPVAASGFLRMANADQACFRNHGNSSDLCIVPQFFGSVDEITVNGVALGATGGFGGGPLITAAAGTNLTLQPTQGAGAGAQSAIAGGNGSANFSGGPVVVQGGTGNVLGAGGPIQILYGIPGASSTSYGDVVLGNRTFANLGTPAGGNGSVVYCTDCLKASNPCTGASTGTFAYRVNGAWACF
jgi:hypothetical protein